MKRSMIFSVLGIILMLTSCVVTQSLTITDGGTEASGAGTSSLVADDFFTSVLEDLSCWTGDQDQDAFLDVAVTSVARKIAESDNSRYVYISKNENSGYSITYGFYDFNALVNDMASGKDQSIIRLEQTEDGTKLSFSLSMDNYPTLTKMIPLLEDPNFEAYGPVYNNPPYDFRSEEDYIYMMQFIFGEEASVIADSTITVIVDTPNPVISSTGTVLSENSTAFELRLIDFLLLHEPITFSCTY